MSNPRHDVPSNPINMYYKADVSEERLSTKVVEE